ncbi:LicD family protein [Pasteurella atlantica]|uniref:LicD family protein n=3 Tax=Pasteurellales TaxID=135625 RepID=A0ACC6HMV1_9PAST|nr:LicD family protein [Pasteurella atlantica]MDP8052200.1 LicD family protein [Pasteurella atlantica]MDP8105091.1 LicD family protein [Pasteurella atlantica]MDP8148576.1 LicD family protein [Pasteurella atlantica]
MKKINLREHQLIALDILKYFDMVCRENNITYSLAGGTLIGAIRHNGFIPWDDDIDVYMCRDEYQKFVDIWQSQNDHKQYSISLAEDIEGQFCGEMTKIFDENTLLVDPKGRKSGIFIDIFIYDAVPNNPDILYKMMKKHRRLKLRFSSCKKRWKRAKEGSISGKIFSTLSHYLFNKMTENLTLFQKTYPIEKAEYIGLVLSDYGGWKKSYMPKNYFDDVIYVDFEGKKYPVMKGYHEHLTMYYGDYMTLPPEEEQKPHHTTEVYILEK